MTKRLFIPAVLILFSLFYWMMPGLFRESVIIHKWVNGTEDILFRIRHSSEKAELKKPPVVLITIDDESCEKLGARWPWSRKTLASLVEILSQKGAALIALNLTFTGLEADDESTTQLLADAMRDHGRVLVGATFDRDRLIKPTPLLMDAKVHYGYVEKIVDDDFVIRRSYLARAYKMNLAGSDGFTRWENSFPLEMAELGLSERGFRVETDPLSNELLVGFPGNTLRLDKDGGYRINYVYTEDDFVRVPAWRILQDRSADVDMKGRAVLVGITSSALSEKHTTSLGLMSGLAVHGNEFASLVNSRHLKIFPERVSFIFSWILSLALMSLLLFRRYWISAAAFSVTFFGIFILSQACLKQDWIIHTFPLLCGPLMALAGGIFSILLQLLMENQGLTHKVLHDKMTGLYTYDYLRVRLDDEWKRCQKMQLPVSVVMTDLDRFKKINDTLGHEVGNQMILKAAAVIRESVRGYDVVSRYGGDEFVVLLWHANAAEAEAYRQRLRLAYETMAGKLDEAFLKTSSISIGFASYDPKANSEVYTSPQQLIEAADKNLFEDKESRRKPGETGR